MISGRAEVLGVLALAVLFGIGAWLIGMQGMPSALLATVVFAAGAGRPALERHAIDQRVGRGGVWPPRSSPLVGGTRREVQELSWSFTGRRSTSGQDAVARLRGLARHRLALRGVDLSDPTQRERVDALIGSRARLTLSTPEDEPVRHRDVVACLEAIERLAPPATAIGPTTAVSTASPPTRLPSPSEQT